MPIERPHLLLAASGERYDFSPRTGGGGSDSPPEVPNRGSNARRMLREVRSLVDAAQRSAGMLLDETRVPMTARARTNWGVSSSVPGRRNDVMSVVGFARDARVNIALDPETLDKFDLAAEKYLEYDKETSKRRPNHYWFFEAQPSIGLTTVEDLWASKLPIPEQDRDAGWEIWLSPTSEPRLREVLDSLGLKARRSASFEKIRVLALEATRQDLERLAGSAAISQLRPASSLNAPLIEVSSAVQEAAVTLATRRIDAAPAGVPAVCILDTGVAARHPLLAPSLDFAAAVQGGTPDTDWCGHGTQMAGLALFGDVAALLTGRDRTRLPIRLESVMIDPPQGASGVAPLPAERLRQAVERAETEEGLRTRTFCLAMNASEEADDGGPSTLSCELDALASDTITPRLFCVAAGNLDQILQHTDYQSLNETTGMLAPSQAWNALTVAACTDLLVVPATHQPLAPGGDLSPWSRTAVNWDRRHKPPVKPDVVFEGGNRMVDRVSSDVGHHHELCLITTSSSPTTPLTLTGQTSAATASIAGLCARLQAEYPRFWPETVRGLVAHSAEHSPAMLARAAQAAPIRGNEQQALLERFGFGQADFGAALGNAEDALTMVVQDRLHPLRLNDRGTGTVLGQMRAHRLPWPTEVLEGLGDIEAELRVTLSYYVEPNPAAVVRGDVENYASHGFDFDVKRPDESVDQAVARQNSLRPVRVRSSAQPSNWRFGRTRGRGGLKHDRIRTTAENLARMDSILVFPRKGWWGDYQDRVEQTARYTVIATIRTPEQDIYTEIAANIPVLV